MSGDYLYELIQIDYDGTEYKVGQLHVTVNNIPSEYVLEQNFPNPFNPSTTIKYSIPENSFVTLSVFNSLGEKVAVLVSEMKEAGFYETKLDASNLSSGIYFYTLSTDNYFSTKKMILLK